jgi:hypothetical protein
MVDHSIHSLADDSNKWRHRRSPDGRLLAPLIAACTVPRSFVRLGVLVNYPALAARTVEPRPPRTKHRQRSREYCCRSAWWRSLGRVHLRRVHHAALSHHALTGHRRLPRRGSLRCWRLIALSEGNRCCQNGCEKGGRSCRGSAFCRHERFPFFSYDAGGARGTGGHCDGPVSEAPAPLSGVVVGAFELPCPRIHIAIIAAHGRT